MTGLKIAHLARATNFLSLLSVGGSLAGSVVGLEVLTFACGGLAILSSLGSWWLSELQRAEAARLEAERDELRRELQAIDKKADFAIAAAIAL
jgi:hypothetical protein